MVRRPVKAIAVLVALAAIAGCAQRSAADAEAACTARGITPDTAAFAACLHPSEAAVLQRGEDGWQQMQEAAPQ